MALRLENFRGEFPLVAETNIPENAATFALNCDLAGGQIRGWRTTSTQIWVDSEPLEDTRTIFPFVRSSPFDPGATPGVAYFFWEEDVDIVDSPLRVESDIIIFSGDKRDEEDGGGAPVKMTSWDFFGGTDSKGRPEEYLLLGVPAPGNEPELNVVTRPFSGPLFEANTGVIDSVEGSPHAFMEVAVGDGPGDHALTSFTVYPGAPNTIKCKVRLDIKSLDDVSGGWAHFDLALKIRRDSTFEESFIGDYTPDWTTLEEETKSFSFAITSGEEDQREIEVELEVEPSQVSRYSVLFEWFVGHEGGFPQDGDERVEIKESSFIRAEQVLDGFVLCDLDTNRTEELKIAFSETVPAVGDTIHVQRSPFGHIIEIKYVDELSDPGDVLIEDGLDREEVIKRTYWALTRDADAEGDTHLDPEGDTDLTDDAEIEATMLLDKGKLRLRSTKPGWHFRYPTTGVGARVTIDSNQIEAEADYEDNSYTGEFDGIRTYLDTDIGVSAGQTLNFEGVSGMNINISDFEISGLWRNRVYIIASPSGDSGTGGEWERSDLDPDDPEIVPRTYRYTHIAEFQGIEMEGPPSPASEVKDFNLDNDEITLSGFDEGGDIPEKRGITKRRIYRQAEGTDGNTDWFFVHEQDIEETEWEDDVDEGDHQEPLESEDWLPPPPGLHSLTALPGGLVAGIDGRRVRLCVPDRPHAWPEDSFHRRPMDFAGVAMGAFGNTLFVATQGQPYFLQGIDPESMSMQKVDGKYPCMSKRSMVDMGQTLIYASPDGLIAVGSQGIQNITSELYDKNRWQDLPLNRSLAARDGEKYILAFDRRGGDNGNDEHALVFDLGSPQMNLTRLSLFPAAMTHVPAIYEPVQSGHEDTRVEFEHEPEMVEHLIFYGPRITALGEDIDELDWVVGLFDYGNERLPWVWASKDVRMPQRFFFSSVQADIHPFDEEVDFKFSNTPVVGSDILDIEDFKVLGVKPARIRPNRGRRFQIVLRSADGEGDSQRAKSEVRSIALARSMTELNQY